MKPLIWIIDEEWSDYEVEKSILRASFPECRIEFSGNDYVKDLENFGKEADAILCQIYVKIDKPVISRLERCKVISIFGGGYDRVDVGSAKEKGIVVTFVPGYCVEDVSDYVIAAIYYFNKRIHGYSEAIRQGLWGAPAVKQPVKRIKGSTLLVVGFGRIGQASAAKAKALGMNVCAWDPYVDEKVMKECCVERVDLDKGLEIADFLTVHVKLTEETKNLFTLKDFRKMKPTAYIINTSRGEILNEEDLQKAVEEGLIAGAALDVIANEPPTGNEPILNNPKILVTPHISYLSNESLLELKRRATENVVKVLKGEAVEDKADH